MWKIFLNRVTTFTDNRIKHPHPDKTTNKNSTTINLIIVTFLSKICKKPNKNKQNRPPKNQKNKPKWQSRMINPETLETFGMHDTG